MFCESKIPSLFYQIKQVKLCSFQKLLSKKCFACVFKHLNKFAQSRISALRKITLSVDLARARPCGADRSCGGSTSIV